MQARQPIFRACAQRSSRMPVIGIPMKTSDLGGVDSLYSIVQMPSGIPVATVAINGGKNAGILAAKILAASDPELLEKLKAYSEKMKNGSCRARLRSSTRSDTKSIWRP